MKHVAKKGVSFLFLEIVAKKKKRKKSIYIGYVHFPHIYSTFLKAMLVNKSLFSNYQSFIYLCTNFQKYNFKFISDNPLYCKLLSYVF